MTVYAWQLDDNDSTTTPGNVLDYVGIEQTTVGDGNNAADANFALNELVYINGVEYSAVPQTGFFSVEMTFADGSVYTTNFLFETFDLVNTATGEVTEYIVPISEETWDGWSWTNQDTGVTTTSTPGDFFAANGNPDSFLLVPQAGDGSTAVFTGNAYVPLITCFVRGALIEVEGGKETKVEDLRVGDLIRTKDHGFQAIRWIGSTTVPGVGKLSPVVFRKGALGNTRELRVSPEHRMLITSAKAELLFAKSEVLVSAKSLVNGRTIVRTDEDKVEYFHILFDQHEVIFSEGIPSESLYLGTQAIKALSDAARAEIFSLFPHLKTNPQNYEFMDIMALKPRESVLLMNPG